MDIRNPIFTADGRIDCEIDHPKYGWIPFTADPNDVEPLGQEVYLLALDLDPAPAAPLPQEDIGGWRANTSCSRMQGILALGQTRWATIQTYKATATWGEQVVIDGSGVWYRDSQNVAFFGYLLGLTDTEVDDLFRLAITIEA